MRLLNLAEKLPKVTILHKLDIVKFDALVIFFQIWLENSKKIDFVLR